MTSFKDFYPFYSLHKDPQIKLLSEHIPGNYDICSYFEMQMGQATAEFSIESAHDFIDPLNDFTTITTGQPIRAALLC